MRQAHGFRCAILLGVFACQTISGDCYGISIVQIASFVCWQCVNVQSVGDIYLMLIVTVYTSVLEMIIMLSSQLINHFNKTSQSDKKSDQQGSNMNTK